MAREQELPEELSVTFRYVDPLECTGDEAVDDLRIWETTATLVEELTNVQDVVRTLVEERNACPAKQVDDIKLAREELALETDRIKLQSEQLKLEALQSEKEVKATAGQYLLRGIAIGLGFCALLAGGGVVAKAMSK